MPLSGVGALLLGGFAGAAVHSANTDETPRESTHASTIIFVVVNIFFI